MFRPSSPNTMWTSTEDCRCHEHVRHMRSPNCWYAQSSASSAVIASTSGSWSAGALAKEHLLQRVAAKAAAEGLERDDLVRRDVPEVDGRAVLLDEPGLSGLGRRLEDDVLERHRVRDLADEFGPHVARPAEDARCPALTRFRDHLPGAGIELLAQPRRPLGGRELDVRVLRPDLGKHGEVARELLDQLELALARQVDHAVRDLDVREAELLQPALVALDLVLHEHDLEEGPADHDGLSPQDVELRAQVGRDVGGAPAELDDVDVVARRLEHVLPRTRAEALVDHVGQPAGTRRQAKVKAAHRAP